MITGIMPDGLAGPFAAAQAGSSTSAHPSGDQSSGAHEASSSAALSGARGSVAVSLTGGTCANPSATRSGAIHASPAPLGARPAATSSIGVRQGWASVPAKGTSHPPPSAGAPGLPPPGGPDEADDRDLAGMHRRDPASHARTAVSWNVQGSMRGDGVPTALGMLDSEAVAADILKAKAAILCLFQGTGLQVPQSVVLMENQRRHHRYHAFWVVDPPGGAGRCNTWWSLDCPSSGTVRCGRGSRCGGHVLGKAMALKVLTAGGTFTVINDHGLGSGGDSWVSKASFSAEVAMYAGAKSMGVTRPVLIGGGGGTSTYGCDLRDTPSLSSSWHCGNSLRT